MKTNNKIIAVVVNLFLLLSINYVNAQESSTFKEKRIGFEISPLALGVFNIYQFKATYLLNPDSRYKSEIGFGALIQNESTSKNNEAFNNDGIYSAKMAVLAYRQYFWKGLHFEQNLDLGESKITKNVVDGKTYKCFTTYLQSFIGYKLDVLKREKFNLFIIGQAGATYSFQVNKWPTKESEKIYVIGDLKIGINF
jgi:hypothetical protein